MNIILQFVLYIQYKFILLVKKLFYISFMNDKANIGSSHILKELREVLMKRTKFRFVGQNRRIHITGIFFKKFIGFI